MSNIDDMSAGDEATKARLKEALRSRLAVLNFSSAQLTGVAALLGDPDVLGQYLAAADEQASPGGADAERSLERATEAYQWTIEQLMQEDPDFAEQLDSDPELAQEIWAEALQRFG